MAEAIRSAMGSTCEKLNMDRWPPTGALMAEPPSHLTMGSRTGPGDPELSSTSPEEADTLDNTLQYARHILDRHSALHRANDKKR